MSQLGYFKTKDIALPPIEMEDGLTAKDIMDKIRGFYFRLEKYNGECYDAMEAYFLELLHAYPKSMCNRHMTESLKQLIAIYYFDSKPEYQQVKLSDPWKGFSYEDLGMLFGLSKATIYEAIRQKQAEIKKMLSEGALRAEAKTIALDELVKEEKQRIINENKQTIAQTTE